MTSPVVALLDEAAAARPGAPALAFSGRTLTYGRLREDVDRLAGALDRVGVRPGDRVGIVLPNCPQHVLAFFASLRLGAVAVLVDPLATEEELRDQLDGAVAVICLDQVMRSLDAVRAQLPLQQVFVTSLVDYYPLLARLRLRLPTPSARRELGDLTTRLVMASDVVRLPAALKAATPAASVAVDPSDVAVVVRTSGTTTPPRAVELSHANLAANAAQVREMLSTTGVPTTLAVLPLFHRLGLALGLLSTVAMRGKVVLLPRFDPALVFGAVDAEKPSLFPGVPPMFQSLLAAPDVLRRDLRSIRTCVSIGMRLSAETLERFERVTGARMLEAYGSTEAGITHCNASGARRLGTIGRPLADTEARILDVKDPQRLAGPGQRGELSVRGPQVAADDWFATGDLASVDDAGFFTLLGRKDDAFVAGLARVYPTEIEELIGAMPGVADVCVTGVRRGRKLELTAYVVRYPDADLDADAIRAHLDETVPASRVPATIVLRETLPRSVLGHALRREL